MAAYGRYIDFDTLRNQKNEKNNRSTTGTGSSTTARARTREGERMYEDFLRVLEYAEDALQLRAGRVLQDDVRAALLEGMAPEVLIACIQEAELAPRPSWGYARAVLRRCRANGIRTQADWDDDKNRWESRKNSASGKPGGYSQREYRPEDFQSGFFVEFDTESDEEVKN